MNSKFIFNNISTALIATAAGGVIILGMYLYKKKNIAAVPTIWQPVGKVKGLYLYPLKSGRRIELKTADCTEYGIRSGPHLRDRCLVVYKAENKEFKTARTYPTMVLIEVTVKDPNYFTVNAPGMSTLQINIPTLIEANKRDEIVLWENEKIFAIDCGDEAAEWFSKYILNDSSGLRLGFHDGLSLHKRNIETVHQEEFKIYPNLKNATMGLYADFASYMLMNQSSVDELASRIPGTVITVHNFRPNIVVEGDNISPFDEDHWDWIKIGEIVFRNVKPCVRCSLTTINPETGVRSVDHEPLKTLKTYRKVKDLTNVDFEGENPILGVNLTLKCNGQINVGDTVFLGKN